MIERFRDHLVIVTGAASGIGRATALRFVAEGARVIAVDLDAERLDSLATEAGRDAVTPLAGDITQPDFPAELSSRAGGKIDVLANVAGIMDSFLASGDVDEATWDRVLAVNLTAPQRLMKAVLPGMVAAGSGAIVNVASEAGIRGGCAGAAYTASKHGLVGLTRNTAFLYAKTGVRVNAVAPGPVDTGLRPDFRSPLAIERIPPFLGATITSVGQPEDIAATILWLASAEAGFVNGVVLAADGGWSAA